MSLAVLFAAAAGCCLAFSLADLAAVRAEARRVRAARSGGDGWGGSARSGATVGGAAALLMALLARAGRRFGAPPPTDLAVRIEAAGAPFGLDVADVMALKCGTGAAGALLAATAGSLAPGRLGIALLVVAPAAGFLAPDLLLRRRARQRAATIALELADVVELLRVAVGAGLTPMRALDEVGRRHAGLLAAELRRVSGQAALGVPAPEALAGLASRAPGVDALVAAIDRATAHGAPLQPALAALALQARARRTREVKDRAARAAPKIQLVVALLLVPAVLLLVAAALAGSLL